MPNEPTAGLDVKACRSCKSVKPQSEFPRRGPNSNRRSGLCKECQREASKRHYAANRQAYLDRAARRRRALRKDERARNRELVRSLKRRPCADCARTYPPHVMHFDHVRGTKRFNLGQGYRRTRKQILEEAAKCDVVCGNCHARRTYNRRVAVRP